MTQKNMSRAITLSAMDHEAVSDGGMSLGKKVLAAVFAVILASVIIGATGFAPGYAHNAAHDTRHVMVFPCH